MAVPWKEKATMDLKREFVRRHEAGERMTDLCREFEISREWGYELVRRVEVEGEAGLVPRSRAPVHSPHKTPEALVELVGMEAIDGDAAWDVTARAFRQYGVPAVLRSDNGSPFAAPRALAALSALAAMWMRLGIELERIDPGHLEQNGRHERMHRTLKRETTRPAAKNALAQQERFDHFREEFNQVRPHEALGDETPASVYRPSERSFDGKLPEAQYPLHDEVLVVTNRGTIQLGRTHLFLSRALVGHPVGVREEEDGRWRVNFMRMDLGLFDPATRTFTLAGT